MSRRTTLILTISIIIGFAAAIFGVWWYMSARNTVKLGVNVNEAVSNSGGSIVNAGGDGNSQDLPQNTQQGTTLDPSSEAAALRIVRIAVERYGTYSNRNTFENILNVQPFMTDRYKQETDKFIDQYSSTTGPNVTNDFYGITTNVLAVSTVQFSEKQAIQVSVGTQRSETVGNADARVFNQDAIVNAVYEDGAWKIDAIAWQ